MFRVKRTPTGIEKIKKAVYEADDAQRKVVEAEDVLAKAKREHAAAEARLAELVAAGACAGANGCSHHDEPLAAETRTGEPATCVIAETEQKALVALDDESVPKKYRIAFALLANPILDYQRTAEGIWGPLAKGVAKNRVNSQMQTLKAEDIVETLGQNRYRVNRERLAERSGIPIPRIADGPRFQLGSAPMARNMEATTS